MKKQRNLTKAKTSKPSNKNGNLLQDLRNMMDQAKRSVASVVNTHLTALNWQMGRRIPTEILQAAPYSNPQTCNSNPRHKECVSKYNRRSMMAQILTPGTKAPEFELHVTPDQTLSLSELQGRPVIIAFYPADWSPVCSDQMSLYNEIIPEFRKYKAELLGISVDGDWCHSAFAKDRHIHFPLLSDFEPKGAVAKQYGAYREIAGVCERALFVLDKNGVISWSYLSPQAENPGADGILEALENMQKKGE